VLSVIEYTQVVVVIPSAASGCEACQLLVLAFSGANVPAAVSNTQQLSTAVHAWLSATLILHMTSCPISTNTT
jgi:hypothetical protein